MVKQILVHEVAVALIVVGSDGIVLVQIDSGNAREINFTRAVHLDQLLIHSNGSRTRSQSENGSFGRSDDICHDIGGDGGHFFIVLTNDEFHRKHLSVFQIACVFYVLSGITMHRFRHRG